jgi:hypothetical protein
MVSKPEGGSGPATLRLSHSANWSALTIRRPRKLPFGADHPGRPEDRGTHAKLLYRLLRRLLLAL